MARAAVDAPPANGGTCCHATKGPGYAMSLETIEKGPREKLVYVTCVYNGTGINKLDYLATMDLDPDSPTYSQVIHRLPITHIGDELHHSGWNSCSSCHGDPSAKRRFLILPSLLWEKPGHSPLFGYDFWYQPRYKTMISSSWGAPAAFRTCFRCNARAFT
ncbi:Selenium-binding protein 3 [Zea mays]|uniref:Selenium-binding protein 3 n=2 Tax=Zea mays TaxID=4577 RepID=A0A1D6HGH8_MAIZE|nr:Selenium-binding protein 3 [Zea mays]